MKRLLTVSLCALGLALVVGCNESAPGGKTSGHTGGTNVAGVNIGGNSDTFSISGPLMSTSIKQGEKQVLDIKMKRGKDFKRGVKLSAENVPTGVKVEFSDSDIQPNEKEDVKLTVTVDKTATLGEHTIKIVGKPETGDSTSLDVKIKVTAP
jgi:uncharacterized membrane protein